MSVKEAPPKIIEKGSVFQTGGGGTNFEQYVQSAFLTTLITRCNVPCFVSAELIEVAFQTKNRGYKTDDLLAIATSAIGQHRLLIQIKNNITFSAKNDLFKEVIRSFWADFNNDKLFDKANDKLIIIKSGLTKNERNHLKSILNWAKTHATEFDFISEVQRIDEKKQQLAMFHTVLKEANDNIILSDKEIWEFLKCFDILEYDFLNEGSVHETYFINLIKLSKNTTTTASEKEIWNSIIAYITKSNKDGGSVTADSIQKEELYRTYFSVSKLTSCFKSVNKFKSDSEVILKPFKSTIHGFHIDRTSTQELILQSVNKLPITIVTGKPGVGKSAIVKDLIKKEFSTASVFVFRADQFNEPHLANVFAKQGINEAIQDIISCVSLIPEKIILIDSLEKLLEQDPENAFKQLIALLTEFRDIKIIATSRKYAIDLIVQKFGLEQDNFTVINIEPLTDEEIVSVSKQFPQLNQIIQNENIKKILQSPKYLDYSITAISKKVEDYSTISLAEFKNKLWSHIIENITVKKDGLSQKRSKAFSNIAIKRAKKMKLFVEPDDTIDSEGVEALEKDEVIFSDNGEYRFSPSHDILEDWALVKYVGLKYDEYTNSKDFFSNLGNEPAIRRAFRLWVEDYLIIDNEKINNLIKDTLNENTIEKYWADEVLVAMFKSEDCSLFFQLFEKELLDSQGALLNRCLHLIRTSCKEGNLTTDLTILLPIGSGWEQALLFITKHLIELNNLRFSILNFMLEWEYRLLFQSSVSQKEINAAKEIVLHFIIQIENEDEFWQADVIKDKNESLISLLYNLAEITKNEISELINRAIIAKTDRTSWRLNSFYDCVINYCLSGIHSRKLVKELPQLVIDTAWKQWKNKPIPEEHTSHYASLYQRDADEHWGITNNKLDFFPSGIYKTPGYNLLFFHPLLGAKFITEFINYSVETFVKSNFEFKRPIIQIEIELNDGNSNKQWGSWELWAAYRGQSVTTYLLESLLMSIEKYLLEVAKHKTQASKHLLKLLFNYFLKNSNSVAVTSVLSSIAIAYPEEVEEEMLPLFSVEEFYSWDISRSIGETSAMAPSDDKISFAQKERWESNQLIHRKKYTRGLCDFIIGYQFNIRKLNQQIHNVIDKLKTKNKGDDVIWKKMLTEIDIRNHEVGEYDEKLGGYPILAKYDDDVNAFMNSNKDEYDARNTSSNYAYQISKAYKEEEILSFGNWNQYFDHYSLQKSFDIMYDRPISLAILGLKNFKSELNNKQLIWCTKTIIEAIELIIQETYSRSGFNNGVNIMEKEIALESFHLLFDNIKKDKDKNELAVLMIYVLTSSLANYEIKKTTKYIRNIFFKSNPEVGMKVWIGLIKYAQFRKNNPFHYMVNHPDDLKKLKAVKIKEYKFIKGLCAENNLTIQPNEIDFEKHEGIFLARAFVITPYFFNEKQVTDFIKAFINLLTEDFKKEENFSYNRNKAERQVHHDEVTEAKDYLVELLLNADLELSKSVIDLLLDPIYGSTYVMGNVRGGLFDFVSRILEHLIYILDQTIFNSKDEDKNSQLINNFWSVWAYLFEKIKKSNKTYFTSILLLGIEWDDKASYWKPLENKKTFYFQMIKELGNSNVKSIIKVFSTVGERHFLPEGLSYLAELLKNNPEQKNYLITVSGERLIRKLFYNHMLTIKANQKFMKDFVFILDSMVDLGSSQAYMFRENVITYKVLN